jgi:hypothetical protein
MKPDSDHLMAEHHDRYAGSTLDRLALDITRRQQQIRLGETIPAGGYFIGGRSGFGIAIPKRPPWLQRFLMRKLLGWEWIEPWGP